ncbi:sensor histidine kinase [Candidatus Contubernalis alkaliaceticus]|uniref:hypothetical protein n=1 Tax=Candidatus Contubernalis alkaliaceticus TaxID=338645 RepID=UPI001F4C3D23|nr:hypothetical protein [Candidatus Contubernalis alkalaceticus]UNC92833.1 hypothetical protein HUE98_12435 [Candidatus Contubernalis alkalaceticus]
MLLKKLIRSNKYTAAHMVFIITFLIYFGTTFFQPYLGISLEKLDGDQWVVMQLDLQGEGYKQGIQIGDIVVKIDQDDPGVYPSVEKWRKVEGATYLEIVSPEEVTRLIEIQPTPFLQNLIHEAPQVLLSLAFWVTGLATLLKRPFILHAQVLYWFNWIVAMAVILAPASARQILWGRELEIIFFSIIPVMLLKLITVFPLERKTTIFDWSIMVFALLPAIAILMLLFQITIITISDFLMLAVMLSVVIALSSLVILMLKIRNRKEKNQVAIILSGLTLGLSPFIILTAVPVLFFGEPVLNPRFSVMFLLVLPLSFSYVIINKYLPDGKKIFIAVSTFLFSATLAGIVSSIFITLIFSDHYINQIIFTQALFAVLIYVVVKEGISYLLYKKGIAGIKASGAETEKLQSLQVLKVVNKALFFNLEEEKKKLAREIHDGPLQLGVELSRRVKQTSQHDNSESHIELSELADELNFQLRSICTELRPATLSDLGLIPAVELLCQQLMERHLINISLGLDNISIEQRFNEEIETAAYRFIQEGLNNSAKHSGSEKVIIRISLKDNMLSLSLQDYGKGFDSKLVEERALQNKHLGIIGMKERITR